MNNKENIFEKLIEKARMELIKYSMVHPGDSVLIAFSGGPDSMFLLDFLRTVKEEFGIKITCFHLNHMLRGKESDDDEKFAIDYCAKEKINLIPARFDTNEYIALNKLSVEDGARQVRYMMLQSAANEISANKIALGHHADDQVETFVMRMLKGAGLDGLASIRPVRGNIVRPMLKIYRKEILEYLREKEINYRIDKTNLDPTFFRNKIRLEVIPVLENVFAAGKKNMINTIETLAADADFFNDLTTVVFGQIATLSKSKVEIDLTRFNKLKISIKRRILRIAVNSLLGNMEGFEFKHVEEVLKQLKKSTNFSVSLPKNIIAQREYDKLNFLLGKQEPAPVDIRVAVPGETRISERGIKIISTKISMEKEKPVKLKTEKKTIYLDGKAIKPPVVVRSLLPGDRFSPLGMNGTKKIQDYMVDKKIPRSERERSLVLVSGGEIVWLIGYEISENAKVTDKTESLVEFKIMQSEKNNRREA